MAWKLGQDSFSKCISYFADGNTRTFYSLDWTHKFSKNRDRHLGLNRLMTRTLGKNWNVTNKELNKIPKYENFKKDVFPFKHGKKFSRKISTV